MKNAYERAVRSGNFLVLVVAPTDERTRLATRVLRENGAPYINFFGRYTIERLHC